MWKIPIELEIGLKYTRSRRRKAVGQRDGFLSFISGISMAGIALGVAALIVVLSVMNGFQKEVRDRMLSVLSHIEITSPNGLSDWEPIAETLAKQAHVLGVAPMVSSQGLLSRAESMRGVVLRGVDPALEGRVSDLPKQLIVGSISDLKPGQFGVVLGTQLAGTLGIRVGDRVNLLVPEGDLTPAGMMPRMRALQVVGMVDSGHYEYDSTLAVMHWKDAAALLRMTDPTGLRVKVDDMQKAPEIAVRLAQVVPQALWVSDWSRSNRNWFAAVQTEKKMMFIILTLIIAVAAFNLVSTLVMTVTDKQADIAILRTMGASAGLVQRIFLVQGLAIGLLGSLLGVGFGLLIALNIDVIVPFIETLFRVQFLPRDIYFISQLPSDVRLDDVLKVGIMAFVLSILATIYPSRRAAQVKPAEALRYE
ncbi:MAG: lipoprotein-releasing ABC transporter permease subunit [Polynucleobacter sp.]|jgi:lipoprotein-releasing system permease protein|uniref:lipoprotein-releasing ABC transporter permease subunit n=1 Tax=Polynucleobacter sp. HIN8 TaxID=3047867 RepID=UPI001DE767AC|nr:lipoprotein-releasing ABC transporter permease subunit [Polynucleobacter sp. HIN8]MBU3726561.1 lipoprotein-releasing ABC transporter permease subunit [Polynucleobacter sp.]NBO85851.1 lipoprotein-releasing ABC transporter permease subunit [Burkholderiaceae bacterium]NBO87085.1 lipoprotein-releasing ABC transporter permease subunit [Burkholderiaceae bacterium]NBP96968.1 lipoprotein-releasing ABC transporter permease subunit [Burkholderiaceae bacterium]NCA09939.1 lipoprotein-releasing ABC tran